MCGIIGYVGNDEKAVEVILDGLSKLEYRGYDSAGLAIIEKGHLFVEKKSGKLDNLKESLKGAGHYSKGALSCRILSEKRDLYAS